MAIPYDTTNAGVSVRDALGHSSVKDGNTWRHVEKIHVKDGSTWRETDEVYVKSGGSWRLVHEGEHFLFNVSLSGNDSSSDWSLSSYISNQGYSGNKIKGLVTVTANSRRRQVNLGSFSSDSLVYLRIELNARIQARGGNGGNATGAGSGSGPNGSNGQRALYTRTPFILDNASIIAGGGGGGGGGKNSYYQYIVQQSFPCRKGDTCYQDETVQDFIYGGGGGGGAGYPNSNGGSGGSSSGNGGNGGYNGGGGGGSAANNPQPGVSSHGGGDGGNLGQNGQNGLGGGGNAGNSGAAINGWSYRAGQSGNGYNQTNIRGPKTN